MTVSQCAICGAKIPSPSQTMASPCDFCGFLHCPSASPPSHNSAAFLVESFQDLSVLAGLTQGRSLALHGKGQADIASLSPIPPFSFTPLPSEATELDAIWADMILPFTPDLRVFFSEKFQQLRPGGLLYLSAPVKRPFRSAVPLPGQINFFQPKNIMFLLEQHGFKMAWRKNRVSPTLRLIARKD